MAASYVIDFTVGWSFGEPHNFFVETVTLPFFGSSAVSPSQRFKTLWF